MLFEQGIDKTHKSISNTAEYGEYTSGPKVINSESRRAMADILSHIEDGSFARDFMDDCAHNNKKLLKGRQALKNHPIEDIGTQIRGLYKD